ncbi:hypothetical protein [Rhizobium azibense]|uniref:Uncharacterized protein n=1 Tax=Rhizobium azibense TaxID=1136135 RepID=A0A4R3RDS4_9HYPH|nr:hypothetical protein [Rhizobium azibense]TCU32299.1 hypothetical protein EV129_12188 [Rhizobium azibense]
MNNPLPITIAAASATKYAMMAATSRIIDVLVGKDLLTRQEAGATLIAIAEEIRDDAGGTFAAEAAEEICAWFDEVAAEYLKQKT